MAIMLEGSLTLEQAAAELGVDEDTARMWIRSGVLPATTVNTLFGPAYCVTRQAVDSIRYVADAPGDRPRGSQDLATALARALRSGGRTLEDEIDMLRRQIAEQSRQIQSLQEVMDRHLPQPQWRLALRSPDSRPRRRWWEVWKEATA